MPASSIYPIARAFESSSIRRRTPTALLASVALLLSACQQDSGEATSAATFTIGGTISGLVTGASVVLQDNGGNDTTVSANGGFTFSTPLTDGTAYAVIVSSQPTGESCSVASGSGTVSGSAVTVSVSCSPNFYSIGGTVSGLLSADAVVIQDNNANSTTVSANGSFTFSSSIASGSAYSVSVLTQPRGQSCSVVNGSAVVTAADVTNVAVNCSDNTYNVGGTVSGLLSNTHLVLQDNAADNLTVSNGSFSFNTPVAAGSAYAVTVATQPAGQKCTTNNASGTVVDAAISNVGVSCTQNPYSIGGRVSGLLTGNSVVLQDNGGNSITVTANTTFTFSSLVDSGSPYAVTVSTQPAGQTCAVISGSGTVVASNVSGVSVACSDNTYNIGVTVSGLSGTLALQDNGADNLSITSNGTANFATPVASGSAYAVTVLSQPSGQTCSVTGGSGTVGASNVTVTIDCAALSNVWTWMSGSNINGASGSYGTQGVAAAGNVPGARTYSTTWTDSSGGFWLFGGWGFDSSGSLGTLNDLWEYSVTAGVWTWVGGSKVGNAKGIYAAQPGLSGIVPGARQSATSWTDSSGNLWLFGGFGYDSIAGVGPLNDLLEYVAGRGWLWVGGSSVTYASGSYGSQGVAAAGNVPGARYGASSWTDSSGNFWLFGGYGIDSSGVQGYLNDLWKYSPTAGQWTWVGGPTIRNVSGSYGSQGVTAAGNVPGARRAAASWTDSSGNLWLFGGNGVDSSGVVGHLNDLWEYSAGKWVWVSGSNTANANGSYGSQGVAAAANVPGARFGARAWTDSFGNLWLFGGYGYDSNTVTDEINDLWKYSVSTGQWTWVGGSSAIKANGSYGSRGVPAVTNVPGARHSAPSWTDSSGNFWLLGGFGYDSGGGLGELNDLWRYKP